jgi:hypothetical protein
MDKTIGIYGQNPRGRRKDSRAKSLLQCDSDDVIRIFFRKRGGMNDVNRIFAEKQ